MKKTLILAPFILLAVAVVGCSTNKTGGKAIELFNGKDVQAWNHVLADPAVSKDQVWSVEDGVLTCKGTPIGAIYRGPEVTNFRLVVEYRWPAGEKPGNSGIFSRIQFPIQPLPRTFEVQLMHGSAGDVLGLQGRKIAGAQARFFEIQKHPQAGDITGVRKIEDREKPAGEWNRVEIVAKGDQYSVWMNGFLINRAQGVEVSSGPIGLQSEGGVIQFRRVTLTPLD